MNNVDFLSFSISEIYKKLNKKLITSKELVEMCFKRIKKYNNILGAFLVLDEKNALNAAIASDKRRAKGASIGLLDGIPMGLKDMILADNILTTAASKILDGFISPYDATVVKKLKNHGAIILGKLNQDEFAMGSSNERSAYFIARNPFNLKKTPGGSSGGAAASLAADMCFGALGTDTGGSIRQPASFCGIVGIKPTYGRVSRFGIIAYASSLDQVGSLSRDVESSALILEVISGYDKRDSTSAKKNVPSYSSMLKDSIVGLRVGIPVEYFSYNIDSDVRVSVQNSINILKKQGAILKEVSLPHLKYAVATYCIISSAEASSNLSRYDGIRFGQRYNNKNDLNLVYTKTRGNFFGMEVKRRIILGTYVLSAGFYEDYYLRAQKIRSKFFMDFSNVFQDVDILITPTTPTSAFDLGEKTNNPLEMYLSDVFTISANLAGLPALSLNTGFSKENMPIGTQIIGKLFDEGLILNVAYHIEKELSLNIRSKIVI
jgi:aspartyl-tRNA(Asn)/glutamyl-tRNA(Gln) amidotransferase subunit A